MKKGKIVKCGTCDKEVYFPQYRLRENARFCSKHCADIGARGRPVWNKGIKTGIVPKTAFKKGEHFSKGTEFKKGDIPANFKGENVGYFSLHNWVSRHKGKASKCQKCGNENNVQWANKSHEYKRDLSDWMELCYKCHREYDRANGWGKATKKYPQLRRNQ